MPMSKKDFERIAAILYNSKPIRSKPQLKTWSTVVRRLAFNFAYHCPKFNERKFLIAAGIVEEVEGRVKEKQNEV